MKKNSVFFGDVFDFFKKINDNSIDLIIADPPYNQNIDKWDSFKNEKNYFNFTYKWLDLSIKKLNDKGSIYIFNNAYNSSYILTYLISKGMKFRNWIIWHKKDGFSGTKKKFVNNQEVILFFTKTENYYFDSDSIRIPYLSQSRINAAKTKGIVKNGKRWFPNEKGKLCTNVWDFSSVRHKNKVNGKVVKTLHPTPKPENMIERMILASSKKNNIVLDLFSGSGTTSYMAKKLGRNFLSVENNKDYYEYIKKRLKTLKDL